MKTPNIVAWLLFFFVSPLSEAGGSDARPTNTIVLDETGVRNLRLESVMVKEREFEQTIFAIGRIEVYPGRRAAISSRIPGRALEVFIKHDHFIAKGDVAVTIESRQPGNPPPTIELTSPISGLVSESRIDPGKPVSPDDVLAEIIDLTEVYALARVPEHLAGKLKRGLRARISVPAVPGKSFEANLEHLGAMADAESGTVEAAFRVDNPELALRPGMRAEFEIIVSTRSNVLAIPEESIQGDPTKRFIFVRDFELPNAFVKSPVVLGEKSGGWVEVLSGVFPADEVVTRGSYMLGFVGGNSGMSLKEALDAAHGHEHAEDGSELTEEERSARAAARAGENQAPAETGTVSLGIIIYAGASTLLMLVFAQLWWNSKRRKSQPHV